MQKFLTMLSLVIYYRYHYMKAQDQYEKALWSYTGRGVWIRHHCLFYDLKWDLNQKSEVCPGPYRSLRDQQWPVLPARRYAVTNHTSKRVLQALIVNDYKQRKT